MLVARREDVLQGLARDLVARHRVKVQVIAADLSTAQGISNVLAQSVDTPVGLLVAAAGFGSVGPFLEQDAATEANMVDVNCRAVVDLTHAIGQRMARARKGGIILFGSVVGFQGVPWSATYAATKGFVQSFAEGLAVELRPLGISVLSVAPGPVGTGFAARAGMQMALADTPEVVARGALAALPRGGTVRPGFMGKLLGWSLATLPRWGRVRLVGQFMKGMMPRKAKG